MIAGVSRFSREFPPRSRRLLQGFEAERKRALKQRRDASSALGGSGFDLAARGATCYVGRGKIDA
jgi:hypothetical protein